MSFNCPRHRLILYGRRCTDKDCECVQRTPETSHYENLNVGQHVVFHDERQQEVSGTIKNKTDHEVYIEYLIKLDGGGYYNANLQKGNNHG